MVTSSCGGLSITQYVLTNPALDSSSRNATQGVWIFHCHIAWHMEAGKFGSLATASWANQLVVGMAVQFLMRPMDLANQYAALDASFRNATQAFCGNNDDQAFGTYETYEPANLAPNTTGICPQKFARRGEAPVFLGKQSCGGTVY